MGLGTGATAAIVGGIGAAGSIASGAIGASAAGNTADLGNRKFWPGKLSHIPGTVCCTLLLG